MAVLLTVYANCIDGQEEVVNDRITAALEAGRRAGQWRAEDGDEGPDEDESAGQG
ncbi:MAG TPA: hypothetical protein VHG70_16065 [Nocardioidaceae bacterium]|nr:hypothetical protein [Nocardioidaceae bacterium]